MVWIASYWREAKERGPSLSGYVNDEVTPGSRQYGRVKPIEPAVAEV